MRKHKEKENWRQRRCLRWMSLNSDYMHNCTLCQRGRKIIIMIFTDILWVLITCQTSSWFLYFISCHLHQTILKTILCSMYDTPIYLLWNKNLWEISNLTKDTQQYIGLHITYKSSHIIEWVIVLTVRIRPRRCKWVTFFSWRCYLRRVIKAV